MDAGSGKLLLFFCFMLLLPLLSIHYFRFYECVVCLQQSSVSVICMGRWLILKE